MITIDLTWGEETVILVVFFLFFFIFLYSRKFQKVFHIVLTHVRARHCFDQPEMNWKTKVQNVACSNNSFIDRCTQEISFSFLIFFKFITFCIIAQQSLGEGSKQGSVALNQIKRRRQRFHSNSNLPPEVQQLLRPSGGIVNGCCLQATAADSEGRVQAASMHTWQIRNGF